MEQEAHKKKLNKLAQDVLTLSRNTLLVHLRFLDAALSQFELIPIDSSSLLTDGKHILYNPRHVLETYKSDKETSIRDYLHLVMHCIFQHMFMDPSLNRLYWDLACDIAVENVITELGLMAVSSPRETPQNQFTEAVKNELKYVTAEKIYSYLVQSEPDPNRIADIRGLFYADNHEIWYMTAEEIQLQFGIATDQSGDGGGATEGEEGTGGNSNEADESRVATRRGELAQIWQGISERMQVDMETFGKQRGLLPGALTQNLAAVNRERYDYAAFLKRFAVVGEQMRINDDEFDYNFYTYGLELYGKMPLIEPLEYKEVKAIKDFVIAIDTSGSTSGELVQKFIQKTYNILKSTESFFAKINLHIIQCDADIQEDKKITCQEEFDEYIKTIQIRGLGGTDFCPVFEYVDELRRNQEFTNLKGLIYLTDGYGTFPAKKPDFDTAFVFVDDEYNNPDVPPWAIKLVLPKDEI